MAISSTCSRVLETATPRNRTARAESGGYHFLSGTYPSEPKGRRRTPYSVAPAAISSRNSEAECTVVAGRNAASSTTEYTTLNKNQDETAFTRKPSNHVIEAGST